jgi:hypothetical protein
MGAARSSQRLGRVTEPPRPLLRVKRPTRTGDQAQFNGELRMRGSSWTFVRCFLGQGSRRISQSCRSYCGSITSAVLVGVKSDQVGKLPFSAMVLVSLMLSAPATP